MKNKFFILILLLLNIIFIGKVNASTNLVGLKAVKNYDFGNVYRLTQVLDDTNYNKDLYWFFQNKQAITEDYIIFTSNIVRSDRSLFSTLGSVGGVDQGEPYNAVYQDWSTFFNETNISIWLLYQDQQVSQCSIDFDDGLILCPIRTHTSPLNSLKVWFRSNSALTDVNLTINLVIQSIAVSYNNLNSQMVTQQQQTNTKLDGINSSINSSNTSGGESAVDDLKNNSAFQDNSGLSSVVSMPLTFVNSLSNTCQPISLNIPYFDVDMQIPCFQSIITEKMPALASIIKVVINGFIIYRVLLDIFQIIRNAKNPEDDRIEVLDL